ncbi:hypothetical protein M433DRAFT_136170 [Acidomyces richmondensis BFW]|nr:MAG: hypothetical protein FE78DRAFT_34045 [Acidomyces sp. 'richmondensis']KYG43737.1 hypothetical protein M433DRAFT_136170 [Acidomyces richmondensis BFW]
MDVDPRSPQRGPAYLPRPCYPQITTPSAPLSASQSVFQSTSSLSSVSSYNHAPQSSPNMLSQQTPTFAAASAPLPSPSSSQHPPANYFNSIVQSPPGQVSHPQQQQRLPTGQHSSYIGQRGGGQGGTPETAPFLRDFNLVAEAAKRAQMACLARDLGDVGL